MSSTRVIVAPTRRIGYEFKARMRMKAGAIVASRPEQLQGYCGGQIDLFVVEPDLCTREMIASINTLIWAGVRPTVITEAREPIRQGVRTEPIRNVIQTNSNAFSREFARQLAEGIDTEMFRASRR